MTVELQQREAFYGETVRIACQVRGKPSPSVTWLHNARPLTASSRHRMNARSLRVFDVGPQDDGLYQCMAENGVGSSQASTRLITISTGDIPFATYPNKKYRNGCLRVVTKVCFNGRFQRNSRGRGAESTFHCSHSLTVVSLLFPGVISRAKLPPAFRPPSPDKVLREQPPVRSGSAGVTLPFDCVSLPAQVQPADAPVILSQPRTGKADHYELTWRPRHERGAPVLEYMVKYRKVERRLPLCQSIVFLLAHMVIQYHNIYLYIMPTTMRVGLMLL